MVVVEKVIAGNSGSERPLCIGGKRHRPPEDCGGISGYRESLKAIRDPRHQDHDEMLDWVGGQFDPQRFDLDMVNRGLAALSVARLRVQ